MKKQIYLEKNSSSKINQDKTEILTFGNWEDLKEITPANLLKTKLRFMELYSAKMKLKKIMIPKFKKLNKSLINGTIAILISLKK